MYKKLKKQLLINIFELKDIADQYLNRVPPDIVSALFDNAYMDAHDKMIGALMRYSFEEDELDWINWLMYDTPFLFLKNESTSFKIDNKEYSIKDWREGIDLFFEIGLIKEA